MARYLTQKQIDEFRECFSLYDKKKQNKVDPIIQSYLGRISRNFKTFIFKPEFYPKNENQSWIFTTSPYI